MSDLNAYGYEVFDQTPVAYPIHFERPEPLHIRIRRMLLEMQREQRENAEFETLDEANDFDMPEVDEFNSPYEEPDYDMLDKRFQPEGGAGGETPPVMVASEATSVPPSGEKAENE